MKIIRPTYPLEVSIGILLLILALSAFLAFQIFEVPGYHLKQGDNIYFGVFLVSSAVLVMVLVLWEEFLFPVHVKPTSEGMIFRNHRNKLKTQMLIYCIIPVIFVFIYLNYEVNLIRFLIWAAVCIIMPIAGKLISGIKNYNDFLRFSDHEIQYKNNEKEGTYKINSIEQIVLIKDERKVLHKVQLITNNKDQIMIDLDEMELEAFIEAIEDFISTHYKSLAKVQLS